MLLPDHEIEANIKDGVIGLEPFDATRLQPASVDLTLADEILTPRPNARFTTLDCWDVGEARMDRSIVAGWDPLEPGEFILGCTRETVTLPREVAARVEGKSSLGRIGLAVHITAGFIDPGFHGQITLEIANLGPWPIRLRAGMAIAQIAFMPMCSPPDKVYGEAGNHYQNQTGPTESRYRMKED